MTTMTIDQTTYSSTVATFSDFIMRATLAQVEQASVWYFEAESVAREVAANMSLDLDRAACIVSAFSPRERWSVNVRKALAYSVGLPVAGLPNNLTMAADQLDPMNVLRAKHIREYLEQQSQFLNADQDGGTSVQGNHAPASTTSIAAVAAGGGPNSIANRINLGAAAAK